MPLDTDQITVLITCVANTLDDEIDCGECLAEMAEFAETELAGAEIPEALKRVQAHVEICIECTEEYRALLDIMRAASIEADV